MTKNDDEADVMTMTRDDRHIVRPDEPTSGAARTTVGVRALAPALVLLGAACVAVTVVAVVWTHLGQRADERSRWSISVPEPVGDTVVAWLGFVNVPLVAVGLVVCAGIGLARRRPRAALGAALLVAGANITTQLLKAGIPRPSYGSGFDSDNSLPSGHTTVFVSLALALLLVAPRVLRPAVVAAAAAAATFTGAAVVLERWHRPSDVVAAFGVCGLWAGVALLAGPIRARTFAGARVGTYLGCALAGATVVGLYLLMGGLVPVGEPTNVVVGGVMLTVLAVVAGLLCTLVALGADARD